MIDVLLPLKLKENRVWRIYLGGLLLDELRNSEIQEDCFFPEDWLASVVSANNPPRDDTPEREGLSEVVTDGNEKVYLKDLIDASPEDYLGEEHISRFGVNFGVLTKFLDSAERLPIQVHPTKAAAKRLFNSDYGKTESWYILNGRRINGEEPYILLGFKKPVTSAEWKDIFERQDTDAMQECMHKIPVKTGDVFLIEGGTPHAIGSGCFLLEVQEPTDYTISMEKNDLRGKRLPDFLCHMGLGFDKMFECFEYLPMTQAELFAKYKLSPTLIDSGEGYELSSLITYQNTSCFALNRLNVSGSYLRKNTGVPSCLAAVAGSGKLTAGGKEIFVKAGDCLFVPAKSADFTVTASEGETLTLLDCLPPKK